MSDPTKVEIPVSIRSRLEEHQSRLKDPAYRAELERAERDAAERDRQDRVAEDLARRNAAFVASGVPRRVRDLLASDAIEATPTLARVQEWVKGLAVDPSQWCLVLSGHKGSGKSVAAGWWLKHAGVGGVRRWHTAPELSLLDWYDGAFTKVAELDGPLVIDDLGSEFSDGKGFFQQRLDALIDARYREYRPTLITTNIAAKELGARYGERVVDRMREGGTIFETRATSMRGSR